MIVGRKVAVEVRGGGDGNQIERTDGGVMNGGVW